MALVALVALPALAPAYQNGLEAFLEDLGQTSTDDRRGPSLAALRERSRHRQVGGKAAYELANGCYALRSKLLDKAVVEEDDSYTASADEKSDAEPFRMQATALGKYLLYGDGRDFMAAKSGDVKVADEPDDETGSASGDRHPPHGHRGGVRNQLPFSELGEHMIQRMSEKGMIIDPGHLGVIARDGALDLLEDRRYPGVISSHSWADVDSYPRIHEMGGLVTPYAGDSEGFVEAWDRKKPTLVDGPRAIALPRKTTLVHQANLAEDSPARSR